MTRHLYGGTWWGKAWLSSLADRFRTDPTRLVRARTIARGDDISSLSIMPGVVDALVRGDQSYAVTVTVPVLNDAGRAQVLDLLAAESGHLAALLDGELPAVLGHLVPGPGDLHTTCSCPAWADQPCEHAAAVCYRTAEAFDADPFILLLVRGLAREVVRAELRDRRKPTWSVPEGMLAKDAFRRELAALPSPVSPPSEPGSPDSPIAEPPAAAGVSAGDLAGLAAAAARRAWELLGGSSAGMGCG